MRNNSKTFLPKCKEASLNGWSKLTSASLIKILKKVIRLCWKTGSTGYLKRYFYGLVMKWFEMTVPYLIVLSFETLLKVLDALGANVELNNKKLVMYPRLLIIIRQARVTVSHRRAAVKK